MNPNATDAIDRACEGLARDLRTPPAILRALAEIERIIDDERSMADDRRRLRRARIMDALVMLHTSKPAELPSFSMKDCTVNGRKLPDTGIFAAEPEDPEPFCEFTGPMGGGR